MPTQTAAATYTADGAKVSLAYAQMLVADLTDEQFAHMPHPTMNHPCFCLGHLSIYPDKVLQIIGKPELTAPRDGYPELFAAGVECVEQDGRYPGKDEVLAYYVDRYQTGIDALQDLDEAVLEAENPVEGRLREMAPTIGSALNFMFVGHTMAHLGQISAWRRAMGLPGVM